MARQHRFRLLISRVIRLAAPLSLTILLLTPAAPSYGEAPANTAPSPAAAAAPAPDDEADAPPPPAHWRLRGKEGKGRRGHRPPMPPPPEEPDLSKLSPEERGRFERNKARWDALAPDEKEALRKHHEERRERMMRSIDRAIEESGLKLDEPQRRAFARRFMEERRRIEHDLRQEMNEKRKKAVSELIQKLAGEFQKEAPADAKETGKESEAK